MPPRKSSPAQTGSTPLALDHTIDGARLHAMFGHASAGILLLDLEGRYTYVNQRFCEMLGYAHEELVGRVALDLVHPDDHARDRALFERLTAEGVSFETEKRFVRKDGAVCWAHNGVSLLRDDVGRPQSCFAVSVDITPRREEEARLLALKDKLAGDLAATTRLYNLILTSASDYAIYTFDRAGLLTSWNPGAESIYGYASAEALGFSVERLHTPEDNAAGVVAREMAQVLREGRAPCDLWKVRRDGSRFWGNGVVMPLVEAGDTVGFFKVEHDVTAQREVQEERARLLDFERRSRQEAEDASAAKDRFLAALSHELRTPLAPVQMAVYALERERRLSAGGRELLRMINRNLNAEARLIDDLLDVSRIVHGKLEFRRAPMHVHACVLQAVEACGGETKAKKQRLTVELAAAADALHGDPDRLRQVFCNILQNAAKFTPIAGAVHVRSSNPVTDELLVEIADTGVGIEPAALGKIFSVFEQQDTTTTRRFGGLGLGLAICEAVVTAHGGRIVARSAGQGQGAVFAVTLPLTNG